MPTVGRLSEKLWCSPDRQLGVHRTHYKGGEFHGLPHTHAEYNVSVCLAGRMRYLIEARQEVIGPGGIVIINPGEVHIGQYGTSAAACDGIGLHVSAARLRELLGDALVPATLEESALRARGKLGDTGRFLARVMVRELEERRPGYEVALEAGARQLLLELFRHHVEVVGPRIPPPVEPQLTSWEMVDALEYMSGAGKSGFYMPALCARLGTSPSRFNRLFRNSSGISPQAYYNEAMVARAKELLRDGARPVKEVAYDLGFRNDSHFCRLFRRVAGVSPQRFRGRLSTGANGETTRRAGPADRRKPGSSASPRARDP